MQTVIGRFAALLAAWPLTACVPYPVLPGPRMGSHSNVPAEVPSWLVAGQTTRQEVLTALGKPDWVGPDMRSVAYWSAYGHGGAGAITCIAIFGSCGYTDRNVSTSESREFRRLSVKFNDTGLVSDAKFIKMTCPWLTDGVNGPYKMTFMRPVHVPCALGENPFGDLEPAASADSVSSPRP